MTSLAFAYDFQKDSLASGLGIYVMVLKVTHADGELCEYLCGLFVLENRGPGWSGMGLGWRTVHIRYHLGLGIVIPLIIWSNVWLGIFEKLSTLCR